MSLELYGEGSLAYFDFLLYPRERKPLQLSLDLGRDSQLVRIYPKRMHYLNVKLVI